MKFKEIVLGLDKTNIKNFHRIYFRFHSVIAQLEFLNSTSSKLYVKHFSEWSNSLNKQLLTFDQNQRKEHHEFLKAQSDTKIKKFALKDKRVRKFVGEQIQFAQFAGTTNGLLREMNLIYLVTNFEEFLKNSLRLLYEIKPDILKSSKKIDAKDLLEVKNYEEVTKLIIEKEIDDLLREDIVKINDYLVEKLKLDLSKEKNWKSFIERFYRRNILVHNDGKPNELYCAKTGARTKTGRLFVTANYFVTSLNLFEYFSHMITDFLESKYISK